MEMHLVLLGDSSFDNQRYVREGLDVISQLREKVARVDHRHAQATLLAVDGSVVADIDGQLAAVPADATHLFVSVGGNDLLHMIRDFPRTYTVASFEDALCALAFEKKQFEVAYEQMLGRVLALGLPTALCAIYDPCYLLSGEETWSRKQGVVETAVASFNDVIVSAAVKHGLPVLHLKTVLGDVGDYANPIEPSEQGADKISSWLLCVLAANRDGLPVIYGGLPPSL